MVERLLRVTRTVIETVAADFAAGLVTDVEGALERALVAHGVMDMSDEWIHGVATRIRANETVHLPTFDELS
jgi:hypothetical protein